jgi:hypothetical protein
MKTSQTKKALLIGINDYHASPLRACIEDVDAMQILLDKNADETPNFSTCTAKDVTSEKLRAALEKFLSRKPEHALIYYSGHGYVDADGKGYLVGKDYTKEDIGMSMDWMAEKLNCSGIPEITVILDCCYADSFAKEESEGQLLSHLRKNVTVLSATTHDDTASEVPSQGLFTTQLIKGLTGAAANVFGHVTAAGLYDVADSMLSPWQQRPVIKSFVTQMSPLRTCSPVLTNAHLQTFRKPMYFYRKDRIIRLTPAMVGRTAEEAKDTKFSMLLQFQLAGLIETPDHKSVYEGALNSSTCKLSPFGHFLWDMMEKKRL